MLTTTSERGLPEAGASYTRMVNPVTALPFVSTTLPMNDARGSKGLWAMGLGSQPGMTGFEQAPLVGSHVPAVWHESSAVHVTGVPAQVPLVHTSPVVQGF